MLINDLLYWSFDITEPVIQELIASAPMQRLKGVDQAGYFEPYVPGGSHSRYEHSVWVFLLLRMYGAWLEEQIAGLLHDVSHGAFSHCLDYAFDEWNTKEHSHQDNIFEQFIKASEIPSILVKYGYNIDAIIDDSRFPLKETSLPDLCADRIDYSLRGAYHYKRRSLDELHQLLKTLKADGGKWYFDTPEEARKFADFFKEMNDECYSCLDSAIMFQTVGEYLRHAIKQWYITRDDAYTTDRQVIDKINVHLPEDVPLQLLWNRMNGKVAHTLDPEDYTYHVFCKKQDCRS